MEKTIVRSDSTTSYSSILGSLTSFSPAKLLIHPNDGKFNKDFSLEKEQKLGIFILNN